MEENVDLVSRPATATVTDPDGVPEVTGLEVVAAAAGVDANDLEAARDVGPPPLLSNHDEADAPHEEAAVVGDDPDLLPNHNNLEAAVDHRRRTRPDYCDLM